MTRQQGRPAGQLQPRRLPRPQRCRAVLQPGQTLARTATRYDELAITSPRRHRPGINHDLAAAI